MNHKCIKKNERKQKSITVSNTKVAASVTVSRHLHFPLASIVKVFIHFATLLQTLKLCLSEVL